MYVVGFFHHAKNALPFTERAPILLQRNARKRSLGLAEDAADHVENTVQKKYDG